MKKRRAKSASKPRVLFFDIETTYIIGAVWNVWEVNVAKILEDWRILCVAYKWEGEPVRFIRTNGDDRALCEELSKLFSEADLIIAQNGDKFDIKKTNTRMIMHGLLPPAPYKTIDTLKIARKYFGFLRNDLDSLGEYFGVGKKVKHEGIDLWHGCMKGERRAWKKMERYNRRDVTLLWRVYHKMRPWIRNYPKFKTLKYGE